MAKIDYKKELKEFYSPSTKEVSAVTAPKMNFLMVDGKGDPNTSKEFADAIETLYPVAYTIKFAIKKSGGSDFGIMPLEGLWWSDDMDDFVLGKKDNWFWTAMIMQPECVTKEIFEAAVVAVKAKKNPVSIDKIRFESYDEGRAAQIMHIGPFADEATNIKKIHDYITNIGGKFEGKAKKHHEIYLSDMRKTAPGKLKTIVRQPFII
ncbi:MAG: GyrI-like domain-containing protein [Candidatus Berkelbacteria bacterium]